MKKLMLALAAVTLLAVPAVADVLWDQYTPDPNMGAANDSQGGCFVGAVTHFQANDVSFAENVTINSISTVYDYYNDPGLDLSNWATEAYLMIIPKTGNLMWPTDDPRLYGTVPVTVTIVNIGGSDYQELNASGLDITLEAGDYWVSFNPIAMNPIGFTNQHFIATTQVGDGLMYATVCAGGPWYTSVELFEVNVDSTLLIEGVGGVVATEGASWGELKALYR